MAYSFKGAIAFGLVYIPVALVASIKNNDIGFNMIDKKTMSRVKYKKTCVDCENREVKNEDIVKGYQYEKGKYVIFTDKEFEKIKTDLYQHNEKRAAKKQDFCGLDAKWQRGNLRGTLFNQSKKGSEDFNADWLE